MVSWDLRWRGGGGRSVRQESLRVSALPLPLLLLLLLLLLLVVLALVVALLLPPAPLLFSVLPLLLLLCHQTNRKTPFTIYKEAIVDEFTMIDFGMSTGVGRSYRYYTGKNLLYPMGYGMSYTNFSVTAAAAATSEPQQQQQQQQEEEEEEEAAAEEEATVLALGANTTVTLTVKNIGKVEGDEVIMALFVPHPGTVPATAPASRLRQQLFAFERLGPIAPSGSARVSFTVSPDDLALYSEAGDRMVYPGGYALKFTNGLDQTVTKNISVTTPTGKALVRETLF
jgi:hypothetical protein